MTDNTAIRRAMAMLTDPHRAVIYRAYYLARSTAQIAAEDHTTERVVQSRLHDAIRELLAHLRAGHAAV